MTAEALERALSAMVPGHDPDAWAMAAYRTAVARSESAVSEDDVRRALDLLDRAARILTASRSPVEHARILTASANCHRQLGRPDRAASLFDEAADLLVDRAPPPEQAAALINQGLARVEIGHARDALGPLDQAIALVGKGSEEAERRVYGAALINRAQAQQSIGSVAALHAAVDDYDVASRVLDDESPQRGMALHARGAAIMELMKLGDTLLTSDDAIEEFTSCLRVLTAHAFPFQHAVAQHSLAIAHETRNAPLDLERALNHVEIAISMFDPRLHTGQWQTAAVALGRIEARLAENRAGATRADHFVALLVGVDTTERTRLLRDRLEPLSRQPDERIRRDLAGLCSAMTTLSVPEHGVVFRSMLPVLMELPETMLAAACAALCDAHQATGAATSFDASVDAVIHDLLHGPQRVRVRDLLESHGWTRP